MNSKMVKTAVLRTKVFLGDDDAVTILSSLLAFCSVVGGRYTLDCVQMWKTEKSMTAILILLRSSDAS